MPKKNLRLFRDIPLVCHSILAAQASKYVQNVVVSTDDAEIGNVALSAGAHVEMRPAALSTDTSASEEAILHALDQLEAKGEAPPDITVFLQCTAPLTTAADIDCTIETLIREKADSAFSVVSFHHFIWREDPRLGPRGVNHNHERRQMRQQRPAEFLESGSVYAFRTPGFMAKRHRFFGKIAMAEIPISSYGEIDTLVDFARLEAYASHVPCDA